MTTFRRIFLLLIFSFLIISCKKESGETVPPTNLPNFGEIDLDGIFKNKDNRLKNKDSIISVIDNYYRKVWEQGDLWGSLLIAKGDKVIYESYRGYSQDNRQVPINDTVALHVASVSKSMTAIATLKLVEAGKIALDDPLSKYFPGFPYPKVTVLNLLNQRSGLPKYEYFIDKITPAPAELSKEFITNRDVLNLLIRYKPELSRQSDTGFMYCNTNYALLASLVEKVTGVPFPEAMQQIVFRPLRMKNTYIFQEKDTATAAKSFFQRGPKVYPYDKLDAIYGDKNVYTTPRDLLNFSKALYAKNFLRADLHKMVFEPYSNERPGVNNYGLGFRMKIFGNGEKLTYHNGWWHGTNSVFAHLLKSNVTIIAIGNKYSQRVYTSLALSGLFEDFPPETEKLAKIMQERPALTVPAAMPQADAGGPYSE